MFFKTHSCFFSFFFRIILFVFLFAAYMPSIAQQVTNYNEAIMQADKLFNNKNFSDAKGYYQMALKYKSDDTYARERIALIVDQLKGQQVKEEEYYEIIDLADVFYDENAFEKAIEQYNKALQIIPEDEYARNKINEINRLKNEETERIEAFNLEMTEGKKLMDENKFEEAIYRFSEAQSLFPKKEYPKEQIKLAQQLKAEYENNLSIFESEIEEAERYLLIKDYATALVHYEKALIIFPNDKDLFSKIKKIKPEAENQKKYNDIVNIADELYINKDLLNSRIKYADAKKIWPDNPYPQDMITKIDELLAFQRKDVDKNYGKYIASGDSLYGSKEYSQAKASYTMALIMKPLETYPATKIREIDALLAAQKKAFEADYANMIAKADGLFNSGKLNEAKEQYKLALSIRPEDEYPLKKLTEIDAQLLLLAEQEKITSQFTALISEADGLFADQQYELASKKYAEAQLLNPADNYPQQRIGEISALLAQASQQKEIDKKYNNQIILASRLFNEDKLEEAKESYGNALLIKPEELLPKEQIAKIDSLKADRIQQAEINKQFKAYLAGGDSLQKLLHFNEAILAFQNAGKLKPGDEIVAQRLFNVKELKSNFDKEQALNLAYTESIKRGDQYFEEKNYELAMTEFKKASEFKGNEIYPKNQLAQIESILLKMEAEKQKRFNEALTKADNFFEQGNFQEAVIQYKIAASIIPTEQYPAKRIAECNTLIAEKLQKIKNEYDMAVSDADKLYATKIYDKAITAYQGAELLKPDEDYPREMIKKITKLIEDNPVVDIINQLVVVNSGEEQTFNFEPVKINFRKSNYILVKARSIDGNPIKIIFNYGSNNSKNGGFVLQVPEDDKFHDFIVRVGNQYKWFSEDNNWISIYPENGNIEISLVRISKSE